MRAQVERRRDQVAVIGLAIGGIFGMAGSFVGQHLEGMKSEGLELPAPHSSSLYVDIPA